jgi:hypothetical protein
MMQTYNRFIIYTFLAVGSSSRVYCFLAQPTNRSVLEIILLLQFECLSTMLNGTRVRQ